MFVNQIKNYKVSKEYKFSFMHITDNQFYYNKLGDMHFYQYY